MVVAVLDADEFLSERVRGELDVNVNPYVGYFASIVLSYAFLDSSVRTAVRAVASRIGG